MDVGLYCFFERPKSWKLDTTDDYHSSLTVSNGTTEQKF